MTDTGSQFTSLRRFVELSRLSQTGLLVRSSRYLDSLRLGPIRLLLLVQLLELTLVEAEQDIGVVLAGFSPEIAQIGRSISMVTELRLHMALRRSGVGLASMTWRRALQ